MTPTMHLHPAPFALVKSGRKTVETRLNDEKRRALRVGEVLACIDRGTHEELRCRITALKLYDTFEAAVADNAARLGRDIEADLKDLYTFYTAEDARRWGVVAFTFEVVAVEMVAA